MNGDWIEEESEQIRESRKENLDRSTRADAISTAARNKWPLLSDILRSDIQKINSNVQIQQKIGGKIDFAEQGFGTIKLSKTVFPAIYLTVELSGCEIEIKTTIVNVVNVRKFGQRGGETSAKHNVEKLAITLNDANLIFTNESQKVIPFPELSKYLLQPMLVSHTYFPNSIYGGFPPDDDEDDDNNSNDEDVFGY
jgi:hypothetical protein